MKKELGVFQLVVMGIFTLLILVGFTLFANYKTTVKPSEYIGSVNIWGTVKQSTVDKILKDVKNENKNFKDVFYSEKSESTFEIDILRAISSNTAPDLIIVSNDNLYTNLNQIYEISNDIYPARKYVDTFINAFEIFRNEKSILAIPFMIDPMVMYYNKDIFATNSISVVPKRWDEFQELAKKVTIFDDRENIKQSAISFGEVSNIENSKEILATLFLQSGSPITKKTSTGYYTDKDVRRLVLFVDFFRVFSNPIDPVYTWNRSLPNSKEFFLSGNLATYFGFTSEIKDLRLKNPNLKFDIAEIPSVNESTRKTVFANIFGLAVTKESRNKEGALKVAYLLSSYNIQKNFPENIFLPPVRRDLLSEGANDLYMDIFYKEAIFAKSFIDPNKYETDEIFKYMIEAVNGGKSKPEASIKDSFNKIDLLFR